MTQFAWLGVATEGGYFRTLTATPCPYFELVRKVRMMGTFDEWQAQKDSQYILIVEYIEQLAKQHNSSLSATTEYLQNQHNNLDIYSKQSNGNFYKATCNFDNSTFSFDVETILREIKLFLENNQKTHAQQFSEYKLGYSFRNSNYYFKKSELPAIEPVAPSQPQKGERKPHDNPMELGENQKLMRYFETFTPHDLTCFIVDYNPAYNQNDDDFNKVYLLVNKAVNAGILKPNAQNEIPKEQVKEYLKSLDWIYKGFNDNLPPVTADKIGHATITQTMPTDSQLSQQVADLNAQLASATDTIASLQEKLQQNNFDRLESYNFHIAELHRVKTESNQYQKENESLKAKIAKLEANQPSQSDTPADGEPLALVFDSTNANYAPDLVHALNLWLDLYHRNPKDSDSHTNKANIWLKNNTAYEYVKRGDTAMSRIKEIATPLKDFGQQRAKEPKK